MLQDLTITPSTVVILAIVIVLVIWAVRRLVKKGLCDCHDGCDGCSDKKSKGGSACPHCGAAETMVSNMENSLKKSDMNKNK